MGNAGRNPKAPGSATWRSLRVKVVVLVAAVTVVVVASIIMLSRSVLADGYAGVERQHHEEAIGRLHSLVDGDIQDLSSSLVGWTHWDSAVSYAMGMESEAFRNSALTAIGIEGLKADFVILTDWSGRTLLSQTVERETGHGAVATSADMGIAPSSPILDRHGKDRVVAGLASTSFGPAIVASSTILSSGGASDSVGTLVFGRFLAPAYMEDLSRRLGITVTMTAHGPDMAVPREIAEAGGGGLGPDAALAVSMLELGDSREAVGHTLVRDVAGRPAAMLEVRLARDIWLQGQRSARVFLWTTVLVCLLLGAVALASLEVLVVRRLRRLAESASAIGSSPAAPLRLDGEGRDELGQLARAVNDMLGRLDATHRMVRESELRLREAQTAGRIGSWRYYPATYETQWSEEMYRIHGMSPSDTPLPLPEAYGGGDPLDAQDPVDTLARGIECGEPFEFERRVRNRADGTWRIVLVRGQARTDETAGGVVVSGTMQDVTAHRALEAERAELQAQLWHAQKLDALGTLAGGVAHELNNVLGPVVAYSSQMMRSGLLQAADRRKIEGIHRAGERATELVRQILMFGRKRSAERRMIVVRDLLDEVQLMVAASLPSSIEMNVAESESPDGLPVTVAGDPDQLHAALLNICVNAGHAMKARGGQLFVRVSTQSIPANPGELAGTASRPLSALEDGMYARIDIEDTGDGIMADVMPRIFEPFFTTKSVGEGTGLGLSLVHGVVTAHSGTVLVSSTPGAGTVFTVLLPLASAGEDAPGGPPALAPAAGALRLRVMYVDDDPGMRDIVAELMPESGIVAETASSAAAAVSRLESPGPAIDVVVTDQTMPGMTGIELAAVIRDRWPAIPLVMCTGYAGAVEEECRGLGIDVCLQKPFEVERLAVAVREAWLARHGSGISDTALIAVTSSPGDAVQMH